MQTFEELKDNKANEAWVDMLDSLVDFISASKTMVKIINRKLQAARDKSKSVDDIPSEMPRSISLPDDLVDEIHINPSFNVNMAQPSMPIEVFQEDFNSQPPNVLPRHYSSNQFLAEQYNLTKQAIARRYRPQNRAAANSAKPRLNEDYFMNEMFTEGLFRIANISCEKFKQPYQEKYQEITRIKGDNTTGKKYQEITRIRGDSTTEYLN